MQKFVEIQGQLINTDHIIRIEPIGRSIGVNKWHPAIRIYTIVGTIVNDSTKALPVELWVRNPQSSEEGARTEAGAYIKELFADSIISTSISSP